MSVTSLAAKMQWILLVLIVTVAGASVQTASMLRSYKVTTILSEPFVMFEGPATYQSPKLKGFLIDILDQVSILSNVTFTTQLVRDSRYGSGGYLDRSNWTGIIGELQRKEADIAMADLTATHERSKVVDFSVPFFEAGLRILIKKPMDWTAEDHIMVLLYALKPEVWIITILLFAGVAVLLSVIGRFSPWEYQREEGMFSIMAPGLTLHNSLMFTFSSLVWQGFRVSPRSTSGRILACFWWIYVVFFLVAYGANLTAFFLTKEPPSRILPFTSFHEMSKQTAVDFGFLKSGSTHRYFQISKNPVDRRIWDRVNDNPSLLSDNIGKAVDRVKNSNGRYAFIMEGPQALQFAGKSCDLMVIGEPRSDKDFSFACRKGLAFCREIDAAILKLKETNTMHVLKRKWFTGPCFSSEAAEYVVYGLPYFEKSQRDKVKEETGISLKRFITPLILLLIGVFLSVLTLVGEIFWAKRYGEPRHVALTEEGRRMKETIDMSP